MKVLKSAPILLALLALTGCSGDDDDASKPARDACDYHADCGMSRVCFERECYPTASCLERTNCRKIPVCEGERCFCDEDSNRCIPSCVTDNDCSADGYCLDGVCTKYPTSFDGTIPGGDTRGDLQVGLGISPLDFPMGVSMAGYGSRVGPRTPYQDSLGGSNAWFDRPDVRALAFDDGKELFVLLRIPTSWTTDFMLARTAEKVLERTGTNLLDKIISSSPHSHSHPARYWHLVVGLGFGFFGYGEFNYEIFERLTDSFADAVVMAVESREPASFGYTVLDDFDPTNRIHRDRRDRNDNLAGDNGKDARMIVMRIDDADGEPMAVLSNFGIHGTVFGSRNPVLTGDAGGGVEVILTERASKKYGRPVFGFFIQGNAGDISPGGDDKGHTDFERIQLIGERTWRAVEPALDSIQTKSDVRIGVMTGRIPISHEALGYAPGTFFDDNIACENTAGYFRYGAFQCVEGFFDDKDPDTMFTDGDLACVFAVECLTDGYPVPQFQKTVLSVAQIDSLALVTMPGEPLSQFGRDHSAVVVDAMEGVTDATIVGYSQDHHFYLLNEDDWLQGGYEPSRDIWGWRLGPYLKEKSLEIAKEVVKEPEDRIFDNGNLKPMYWVGTPDETARVEINATEGAPDEILIDTSTAVELLSELQIEWRGGHPGVDQPRVTLERNDGTEFVPVTRPGGLPYDDAGFDMIVVYRGKCGRSQCEQHKWAVRWQQRRDFELGTYRLHVTGNAMVGTSVTAYDFYSSEFELVPSSKLDVWDVAIDAGALVGNVSEPPMVAFEEDGDAFEAEDAAFLLRSEEVGAGIGAPLPDAIVVRANGTVRAPGGGTTALDTTATLTRANLARRRVTGIDAEGNITHAPAREGPTSRFSIADPVFANAGDYFVTLTLTDDLGHAGTVTATVTR